MTDLRFRLLQARTPDEVVRAEEVEVFAARLGVHRDAILPFDVLSCRPTHAAITDGVDAVLVGGSGRFSIYDDAPWLPSFVEALGELAARQFPTFASCFGFQGLVVALGGEVIADPDGAEVGSYDLELTAEGASDPLFSALPPRFVAQEGHKDRATAMPEGAVWLARSERCPYQALRIGEVVYATQFHPELTRADNRLRFSRYLREYSAGRSETEARAWMEGFRPSAEANGLLARFAARLR